MILLIGCHRSGTSLVSNMMHKAGVHMYDKTRLPDKWNPGGYGEDEEFKAVNKAILYEAGGWWARPPMIESIKAVARLPKYQKLLSELIGDRNRRFLDWGIKDPRLCLLARYYPEAARVVFVLRNTDDIVKSLMQREEDKGRFIQSDVYWTILVARYLTAAHEYVSGVGSKVIIDYDRLTNTKTKREELRKLENFIGRPIDASMIRERN